MIAEQRLTKRHNTFFAKLLMTCLHRLELMTTILGMQLTENEYRTLVEQAPIMVWRSNLTCECDYFNQRWLEFTGRTLEQEQGNGWVQGVHPEDLDHCVNHYLSNFNSRNTFEMEYRLKRHDGVYRWIFDRGSPFFDVKGSFGGFIGSCIDVTDRVEAQEALKKAQEAELKILKGLLPICMHCKKIRDDKGYWREVEFYIQQHTDVSFSHDICKECRVKYHP